MNKVGNGKSGKVYNEEYTYLPSLFFGLFLRITFIFAKLIIGTDTTLHRAINYSFVTKLTNVLCLYGNKLFFVEYALQNVSK